MRSRRWWMALATLALVVAAGIGAARLKTLFMGRQPDGDFIVSSGQRIEGGTLAFDGRPIDLALHPTGNFFAVLNKREIFLADAKEIFAESRSKLPANAAPRGLVWSPDGARLFASTDAGVVRKFILEGKALRPDGAITLAPEGDKSNPVPSGMAVSKDGGTLYVAAMNRNAIAEVDLKSGRVTREHPTQMLPFEVQLTPDESLLVVSNWGGRPPKPGEKTAKSQDFQVLVDEKGAPASGTVSLIDLRGGPARHVEVGIHPTAVAIAGERAYVANAMSDSVSEVDLAKGEVSRTFPIRWGDLKVRGCMPNALAIRGGTLYVANGGDNALCEIDLESGKIKGFRPAGYFPTALAVDGDAKLAFALNTKGNGSVAKTLKGLPGNAHDFQGTVSVIDLSKDLKAETDVVAANNNWQVPAGTSKLKVYNGAIKHVLYIIKENRTYDEVFGDLPMGNGDPKLCSLGEKVMPNHRKIAKEFTLFDNGYVSGTNSADGHNWTVAGLANDYLEHFYVGYSRSYPDDGEDAMAVSNHGALWDAALTKGVSLRIYGEYCDNDLNKCVPAPKDWFEVWEDRKAGGKKFTFFSDTHLVHLKPYIHPNYIYWPLLQSDQQRADIFIEEYEKFSKEDKVPGLMILSLPCDHGEGTNTAYPTPRAMMADNDRAFGRIVEAVSKSPQWKDTCIFVIEDDAQSGPDHVDGHRTVFMAISPYTKRKSVDSTFYTTTNMLRSIGMMLGMLPLNKFDALSYPMEGCFQDEPDLTPYRSVANNVPLDERNPSGPEMSAADKYWLEKTLELDWHHIDAPDPYWLNRINWYSIYKDSRPYPGRPGEAPGMAEEDDDDDD